MFWQNFFQKSTTYILYKNHYKHFILKGNRVQNAKQMFLSHQDVKVPKEGHYCAEVRAHLRPGKSTFVPPRNDNDVQVRHYL